MVLVYCSGILKQVGRVPAGRAAPGYAFAAVLRTKPSASLTRKKVNVIISADAKEPAIKIQIIPDTTASVRGQRSESIVWRISLPISDSHLFDVFTETIRLFSVVISDTLVTPRFSTSSLASRSSSISQLP